MYGADENFDGLRREPLRKDCNGIRSSGRGDSRESERSGLRVEGRGSMARSSLLKPMIGRGDG